MQYLFFLAFHQTFAKSKTNEVVRSASATVAFAVLQ